MCLKFKSFIMMHCDVSELSELAKQYVLRILFVEQPVTQTVMTAWMTNQYGRYKCILCHFLQLYFFVCASAIFCLWLFCAPLNAKSVPFITVSEKKSFYIILRIV